MQKRPPCLHFYPPSCLKNCDFTFLVEMNLEAAQKLFLESKAKKKKTKKKKKKGREAMAPLAPALNWLVTYHQFTKMRVESHSGFTRTVAEGKCSFRCGFFQE